MDGRAHQLSKSYGNCSTDLSAYPLSKSPSSRFTLQKSKRFGILGLTAGIIFGFLLCFWSKPLPCMTQSECCLRQQLRAEIKQELSLTSPTHDDKKLKKQVLIGVMTAADFIDSRALAVWNTWAKSINGDVVFFSSANTAQKHGLPIIALPGVDDAYPPQKKSFMLVKYLHDYGLDKYEFFMRVDDDVYIRGDKLTNFLSKLNSSETLFIGQAGFGKEEEIGKLSLTADQNYCMGGSGIIFSSDTLRKMVPHISYCLQNLLTSHEDVELGRCVRMFAGVSCNWNYEVQKLFYHSSKYQSEKNAFPYSFINTPLREAITLHPVKTPTLMYKVHREIQTHEVADLESQAVILQRELSELNSLLDSSAAVSPPSNTISRDDINTWTFFTKKCQFDHSTFSVKRNHFIQWKVVMSRAIDFIMQQVNQEYAAHGIATEQTLMEVVSGFRRFHPLHGIQLIIKLKLKFKRFRAGTFTAPSTRTFVLDMPLTDVVLRELEQPAVERLHLILPLSGRFKTFKRFLSQFELICGQQNLNCELLLILYDSEEKAETEAAVKASPYSDKIRIVFEAGSFSRAKALHKGVSEVQDGTLMLFIDVDLYFNEDALLRVRQHTNKGRSIYFPIVFSQYDSQMVCGEDNCPVEDQSHLSGAFRFFGFGITSMYKEDYVKSGGFDMSITGWGKEDVDLFVKMIRANYEVFRSADPGFVHIYHPVICDKSLSAEQTTMCLNSKSASFASKKTLVDIFARTHWTVMTRSM